VADLGVRWGVPLRAAAHGNGPEQPFS